MPKAFTYTAEFNPISFADRVAPLRLYKEEYDKQQAAYEKLLEDTSSLNSLRDIAMDRDSYRVYENFQNDIKSIADEMNTDGLTQNVRSKLLDLRRRQRTEIDPMIASQKKRAELVAEQRKYNETHPNAMFDIDYDEVPINEVSDKSTFRSYDLSSELDKTAKNIYSNILTNNGVDTTDYDNIRSQLNYDSLSRSKQDRVDKMIDLARSTAAATYTAYKDAENLKRYQYDSRYKNKSSLTSTAKRTGVLSISDALNSSIKGKIPVTLLSGEAIPIETDDNGIKTIKDVNGKLKIIGVKPGDDADYEVTKLYYGHDFYNNITLPNGENVIVLKDKVGGNNNYFIRNAKGNIVPITDLSNSTLMEEYYDTTLDYLGKSYDYPISSSFDKNKSNDYTPDDKNPILIDKNKYKDLNETDRREMLNALRQIGVHEENVQDVFKYGYIVKYPLKYKKKKGPEEIVAYRYKIEPKVNTAQTDEG